MNLIHLIGKACFGNDEVNAQTIVNSFLTNLANQIGRTGITKEVIANYVPAIVTNMYDGYYIYAPSYVPVTIENPLGLQLFLDEDGNITTQVTDKALYEASSGGTTKSYEFYYSASDPAITVTTPPYTTDISNAKMVFKHDLSKKIPYSAKYTGTGGSAVVNFTLDNRMYVYKTVTEGGNTKAISRDGYLVYFNEGNTKLPTIKIIGNDYRESDIEYVNPVNETKYGTDTTSIDIQSEILTEQILYTDDELTEGAISSGGRVEYKLGTFKYLYDIEHNKLYYDEGKKDETDGSIGVFFRLNEDKTRTFYYNSKSPVKYKSVSILVGTGETTQYKKIYQALNGKYKGKWYISLKEEENMEFLDNSLTTQRTFDTELTNLTALGLNKKVGFGAIYRDFSAISYYVESYAFTNWVRQNLGTVVVDGNAIFNVKSTNNPEDENSPFVLHKKKVMRGLISESLNLAISNYNRRGKADYTIPEITERDWDHLFENVSILSFVQGIPIGLKDYNNYTIATSQCNREYVNPDGIYLSGADQKYHLPYCEKATATKYTGYRSVEYILKNYTNDTMGIKDKLYYQHDEQGNNNSELACYYCIVNAENYVQMAEDGTDAMKEKIYYQVRAYNEALARERYEQHERIKRTISLSINNMDIIFILDNSGSIRNGDYENSLIEVYANLIQMMTNTSSNYYINTVYLNNTTIDGNNTNIVGSLTNKSESENYINKIINTYVADAGNTPYSNGFNSAQYILNNDSAIHASNKKVIVFLTDGIPDADDEYMSIVNTLKSSNKANIYAINFESTSADSKEVLKNITGNQNNVLDASEEELLDAFIDIINKAR